MGAWTGARAGLRFRGWNSGHRPEPHGKPYRAATVSRPVTVVGSDSSSGSVHDQAAP